MHVRYSPAKSKLHRCAYPRANASHTAPFVIAAEGSTGVSCCASVELAPFVSRVTGVPPPSAHATTMKQTQPAKPSPLMNMGRRRQQRPCPPVKLDSP